MATEGCATFSKTAGPELCDVIKDGTFAVGSFGCMKIQEMATRDICMKASLAGALVARSACLARLAAGTQMPEIGDPLAPEDAAFKRDAQAIIDEWKALEMPPNQRGAPSQGVPK